MLDPNSRTRDFGSFDKRVYLNTAAEGIPPRVVGEALQQYFADKQLGMDGRDAHFEQWEQAKQYAGSMLGMDSKNIGLCSCTSEAYNLLALALKLKPEDEVIVNDLDFPAGVTPWLQLNPQQVKVWRSRSGRLIVDDLHSLLSPRTRLITTSLVSFYNGFRISLDEMVPLVRRLSPACIAVDVTQALGRIPLHVLDVDFVVSSTHKWILSSHGGGIVGIPPSSRETWCVPAGGWLHIDDAFGPNRFSKAESKPGASGFSVGMPNFPAVYALRAALDYLARIGVSTIHDVCSPLMHYCFDGLNQLPVELLTPADPTTWAGILAFRHPASERIQTHMRRENIHVMHQAGRLRVSIHGYNTAHDIDCFLSVLEAALS